MLMIWKSISPKKLPKHALAVAGIALLALSTATANAQFFNPFGPPPSPTPGPVTYNFSTPVVTSPTEAPGVWYTDRFPPCGFVSPATAPDGTKNTLEESICASNFQTPAPSFFNTQGRKTDLGANTYSISINLYVPAAWATTPERLAGFWGTAVNSTGVIGNDYPIIDFQGPITPTGPQGPGDYPNGGVAGFYGWDNTANSGNGGFVYIGLPPGFHYNSWVTLTLTTVPGTGYEYSVRDPGSQRATSIRTGFYDPTETSISNVILEGYNSDNNYSIYWNDLTLSSTSLSCPAPSTGQPGLLGLLDQLLKPLSPPQPPGPPKPWW